jgi:hypothetical protein
MTREDGPVNIATGNARVGLQIGGDVVIKGGIHLGMPAADDDAGMIVQVGGLTIRPGDREGDDK